MLAVSSISGLIATGISAAGMAQAAWGLYGVQRFARASTAPLAAYPPVTLLKPLHGDEPLLEAALETFFSQDYPNFQIVFGVQSPTDPAIAIVRALRLRFPERDVALVIDSASHGANHKISNIINMMAAAKHDVLVVADSDVHAAPDYLRRIVTTLEQPGTGVVTTLYAGNAAHRGLVGALGASYISHVFLPGALLARLLGRQDCLGATMALRRDMLARIGGFAALADHLADDAILGRLTRRHGLAVRLAATVPTTTVPEDRLGELFQHELRWARTIRSLAPLGHALSSVQFPIFWAMLAIVLTSAAPWSLVVFATAWTTRAVVSRGVDYALNLPTSRAIWFLPLRDLICVAVILASYRGGSVKWRGQVVNVGRPLYTLRDYTPAPYRAPEHALGEG